MDVHRQLVESHAEILAGRLDRPLALIAPDVIDHRGGTDGDHHGVDAWRQKWQRAGASSDFRNVSVTIEQNLGSGELSVNRYAMRGTHAASGRSYEVLGIDMVRVRDGRVVEHWALMDQTAMHH